MKKNLIIWVFIIIPFVCSFVSCNSDNPSVNKEKSDPKPDPKPDPQPQPDPGDSSDVKKDFIFVYPDLNTNHKIEDVKTFEANRGSTINSSETKTIDDGWVKLQFKTKNKDLFATVYWFHPDYKNLRESRVIANWNVIFATMGDLGVALLPEVKEYFENQGFRYLGVDKTTGSFGFYRKRDLILLNINKLQDGDKTHALLIFSLNYKES